MIDVCVTATDSPGVPIEAMIVASSRPDGGIELIEWFVLGRSGPQCPHELFGEPERWAA